MESDRNHSSKKIAYEWKYKEYSGEALVEFELFEQHDSTMLKLTHTIVENFSESIPEFTRESGVAGWEYFIKKSLKDYLLI